MRIAEMSDLHLEFPGGIDELIKGLPDADVLLLPGDICVAKYLSEARTDKESRAHKKNVAAFFDAASKKYENILYCFGNHEAYGYNVRDARPNISEFLKDYPNVRIMENEHLWIGKFPEYVFLGATLWTDFNEGDPTTLHQIKYELNDYQIMQSVPGKTFQPEDAYELHKTSRAWLEEKIKEFAQLKVIVFTHMSPSKQSTHPRFKTEFITNGAYSSNLESLMSPNVKLWFHGHTHDNYDYMINTTRVICNPRGYAHYQENLKFNPGMVIEI